jgi:hypothetical protein
VNELRDLLDSAEAFCRRFLTALSDSHFRLLALWVAHTYVIDAAETTPYLHVTSAEPESGKTRVLEVLDLLCCKSTQLIDPSGASLYRGLDSGEIVTLLLDEVDNFLPGGKADSDAKRTIVGLLNGGYRRGIRVPRVTDGRNLQWFEPFGPKALTGIGALPQTLESRSIRYRIRRRRRDREPIERFRRKPALADAEPIANGFASWANETIVSALEFADPELPEALSDRQQDACELLVALADMAGGEWPQQTRDALVEVFDEARKAAAAESRGTLLLADLRDAFDKLGDPVATSALIARFNGFDERPWGGWSEGKGMGPRDLARLLRPFEIRPKTVRLSDDKTPKGYSRKDCEDAFARYLEPQSATSATTAQPSQKQADSTRHNDPPCGGLEEAANLHGYWDVADVADTGRGEAANVPTFGDPDYLVYVAEVHRNGHLTTGEALELERLHDLIEKARDARRGGAGSEA